MTLEAILGEYRCSNPTSAALFDRASSLLPGGSTRAASFFAPFPVYLDRGEGHRVWDVDGRARLDLSLNYTALIHGHAAEPVVARVREQAGRLVCANAPTLAELRLAELIAGRLPSIERLRFTASGTEATMLALRAARAFAGKPRVGKFLGAYHGSHDLVMSGTSGVPERCGADGELQAVPAGPGLARGTLEQVLPLPFNDADGVERIVSRHAHELAAVIVEPVIGDGLLLPHANFLPSLREITQRHAVLLVFDEVIMFRLSPGGAQGLFEVTPDLTVLGKLIGGGLPVGAFGGRRDIMSVFDLHRLDGIHHSGTFNGNPLRWPPEQPPWRDCAPTTSIGCMDSWTNWSARGTSCYVNLGSGLRSCKPDRSATYKGCRNPL